MAANPIQRRLTTILAADVAGYSRLAGADEEGTVSRLRALRQELVDPVIAAHGGRVVKLMGDGRLVEFGSVVDAARCAIEALGKIAVRNVDVAPDKRLEFRIGIHLGDVIVEGDGDLMGDGVNIAARLEGIAEPGGICLSNAAYEQVRDKIAADFTDLGERELKNIARPVRVYAISPKSNSITPAKAGVHLSDASLLTTADTGLRRYGAERVAENSPPRLSLPQHGLHLQGQTVQCKANPPRPQCPLCAGRQRSARWQPLARQRAVDRRRSGQAS